MKLSIKNLLIACLAVALLIKLLPVQADDTIITLGHGHPITQVWDGPGTLTAQPDPYVKVNYDPVSGASWLETHGGNLDDHAIGFVAKFIAERESAIRVEAYTSDRPVQGRPYSILACTSARGTEAAPKRLLKGDDVCTISFDTHWGTSTGESGRISLRTTEDQAQGHRGASLDFYTTAKAAGTPSLRWTIHDNGYLTAEGSDPLHFLNAATPGIVAGVDNMGTAGQIAIVGRSNGGDQNIGQLLFANGASTHEKHWIAGMTVRRIGNDNAGQIEFWTFNAAEPISRQMYLFPAGGIVIGAPLGAAKGYGSLNAQAVYSNGVNIDTSLRTLQEAVELLTTQIELLKKPNYP